MPKTRYIELIDEIRNHVFTWASDEDWKRLPPAVNNAITGLMNELKIQESLKAYGKDGVAQNESWEKKSKAEFIAVFKSRYLEYTDFDYHEVISPATQVIMVHAIRRLHDEGSNHTEYLSWFFDEFATQERNKQYMPPTIKFVCSTFVIDKYLFQMKDALKMKKKNMDEMAVRTMLLGLAVPFLERVKDKDLSALVIEYSQSKITAKKFTNSLLSFAKKYADTELTAKLEDFLKAK